MALLFQDGFGTWNSSGQAALVKGYTSTGAPVGRQSGRAGSTSYSMTFAGGGAYMSVGLVPSGSTSVVGIAIKPTASWSAPFFTLYNGTTYVTLWSTSSTSPEFIVRYGTAAPTTTSAQTTAFTTSLGLSTTAFYYVEMKVIWSATVGRIILRVDSSQYYDSGATLNLGSATNVSTFYLNYATSGAPMTLADLLVMDGSGTTFNDFQGDVRIETLFPVSDGSNTGWTVMPVTNLVQNTNISRFVTDVSGWSGTGSGNAITRIANPQIIAGPPDPVKFPNVGNFAFPTATPVYLSVPNGTSGFAVTAGHVLGVSVQMFSNAGAVFVTIAVRFWDSGGVQVGSDLNAYSATLASTWGAQFGTVTVPVGAVTAALVIKSSSSPWTLSITGFCVVDGGAAWVYVDPGTTHFPNVGEAVPDSDGSYNYTNTLNAKDTYPMNSLVSTTGTVLGVKSVLVARKESATVRVITPVVRISGTDYQGTTTLSPPSNLAYVGGENLWAVSPATSTTWTRTEVNAMELGAQMTT